MNPTNNSVRTLQILTLAAAGMAALLALVPAAGHDQLWFLLMAERWLAGAQLYGPEIFDSNTPAVVWLSSLPVLLAATLHLAVPATAKLLVVLLQAFVATCCLRLLPPLTRSARWFLAFAFVTLACLLPARDFGQRDPLAALLLLPYVLAAALPGRLRTELGSALLAAVAVCLKPQLALVPIALELTLFVAALRSRSRQGPPTRLRPQPLMFLVAGAIFLLAIKRFTPVYLAQALPTTLATYWAIGHLTLPQLLAQSVELHLLALASLAPLPFLKPTPTIKLLFIAALAALCAFYQQGTGWYYQQLPAFLFFGAALAFELIELTQTHPIQTSAWLPAASALLAALALTLTFHFSGYPFVRHPFTPDRTYAITSPDPSFFSDLPPGTPIATLTTSVDDAMMPMARYHLVWAQRTNNLWTLPAILRATSPGNPHLTTTRLAQLAAQQRTWMDEDLTRWHPALILVARCQDPRVHCQVLEDRHDDLLAFFAQDPAFRRIFSHYRFLRSQGDYDAYTREP